MFNCCSSDPSSGCRRYMSGKISIFLMTYSYSNTPYSLVICSFAIRLLLFFVSSVQPVTHVLRRLTPKYWQIGVYRVCANVAPRHHAPGRRPVRMRLVQRLLLKILPLLSVRCNKCNPLSNKIIEIFDINICSKI